MPYPVEFTWIVNLDSYVTHIDARWWNPDGQFQVQRVELEWPHTERQAADVQRLIQDAIDADPF